jgi:hypothetical protein
MATVRKVLVITLVVLGMVPLSLSSMYAADDGYYTSSQLRTMSASGYTQSSSSNVNGGNSYWQSTTASQSSSGGPVTYSTTTYFSPTSVDNGIRSGALTAYSYAPIAQAQNAAAATYSSLRSYAQGGPAVSAPSVAAGNIMVLDGSKYEITQISKEDVLKNSPLIAPKATSLFAQDIKKPFVSVLANNNGSPLAPAATYSENSMVRSESIITVTKEVLTGPQDTRVTPTGYTVTRFIRPDGQEQSTYVNNRDGSMYVMVGNQQVYNNREYMAVADWSANINLRNAGLGGSIPAWQQDVLNSAPNTNGYIDLYREGSSGGTEYFRSYRTSEVFTLSPTYEFQNFKPVVTGMTWTSGSGSIAPKTVDLTKYIAK